MTQGNHPVVDRDELPFVAPCRDLSPLAPFRWLVRGARDLYQAPRQSLFYGLIVAILIADAIELDRNPPASRNHAWKRSEVV